MATDFSNVFGSSILSYVEKTIGPIQNLAAPFSIHPKAKVKAYVAQVREHPDCKVLFTIGLFAHLMKECFICLPAEWPLPHYYFQVQLLGKNLTEAPHLPETLPLDILSGIVANATRKNTKFEIAEGVFLEKSKSTWSKYRWPQALSGMTVIDYYWNTPESEVSDEVDDSTVRLFTIAPVQTDKKSLTPEWYRQRRHGGWQQLALSLFADIAMVEEMNGAILGEDWARAKTLLEDGVNPNRGVYSNHPQWGDIVTYTYLEQVALAGAFDLAKFLVEKGAKVSPDMLAIIAGNATVEAADYFIGLGCDVNAVDNVGYTAMNRALAFKNEPLVEHLISLGSRYQAQKWDSEETLSELRQMGIEIDSAKK